MRASTDARVPDAATVPKATLALAMMGNNG
jgi:hypothetical protein